MGDDEEDDEEDEDEKARTVDDDDEANAAVVRERSAAARLPRKSGPAREPNRESMAKRMSIKMESNEAAVVARKANTCFYLGGRQVGG